MKSVNAEIGSLVIGYVSNLPIGKGQLGLTVPSQGKKKLPC